MNTRLTITEIEWAVATKFHLRRAQLHDRRRTRKVARPRQIIMFLAREMIGCSYTRLGNYFGRDHTTAIHAVHAIPLLMEAKPKLAQHIAELRAFLAERSAPVMAHHVAVPEHQEAA